MMIAKCFNVIILLNKSNDRCVLTLSLASVAMPPPNAKPPLTSVFLHIFYDFSQHNINIFWIYY